MNCESCHTEIPQDDICPNCGLKQPKIVCLGCFRKFYKTYFIEGRCPECHEKELNLKPRNPYLAGGLSIIPGLGQLYIGQKDKGALYLIIFFFTLLIPIIGWFFSIGIIGLSIIDAFSVAKRSQLRHL